MTSSLAGRHRVAILGGILRLSPDNCRIAVVALGERARQSRARSPMDLRVC